MAYTITRIPDGNLSLGNLNGELVNLQPAASDYPTGGYAITSQEDVLNDSSLTANTSLYKILTALPAGGQGGYSPRWNPTTQKLQVFVVDAAAVATQYPLLEATAGTDLSAYLFQLLLIGL